MQKPRYYIICVAILMAGYVFTLQPSPAADRGSIDLINGTINGVSFSGLTVDKLARVLGRPSLAEPAHDQKLSDGSINHWGTRLYYYDKGLYFSFDNPADDKEQRLNYISIYLKKQWDMFYGMDNKETKREFLPYKGEISRNVDGNLKVKDIMRIFSDCEPKDLYKPDIAEKIKKSVGKNSDEYKAAVSSYARVEMSPPGKKDILAVKFMYDATTKIIEKIILVVGQK